MALATRISGMTIENFKNVKHGRVDFAAACPYDGASITGIFGQNGSGKTAVIDALAILKAALTGAPLPRTAGEEIRNGADSAHFEWDFCISSKPEDVTRVRYSFDLIRGPRESDWAENSTEPVLPACIRNEVIEFLGASAEEKRRRHLILDTTRGEVFGPARQYTALTGAQGIRNKADLAAEKHNAAAAGRSFAFSPRLLGDIMQRSRNEADSDLLRALADFGAASLLILTTQDIGTVVFDQLRMHYRSLGDHDNTVKGLLLMPLEEPAWINEASFHAGSELLQTVNLVLRQLVPGRQMELEILRTNAAEDGKLEHYVRVISQTENGAVAFRQESEGIKKIVNALQLLIAVFGDPGITLAVDELDSGMFEYLLGELMQVLDGDGKGQIIFTSHNLRALEVLHPRNAVFTTTDPAERYYRMKGLRERVDMRRSYFRDILLGGTEKELYNTTDNVAITAAFREAGKQAWRVSKYCS